MHAAMNAGARAERGDAGLLGEVPQHAHVGVARVAVVEHDRRLGEQHADEEVPHHPAGRREPEDAVAGLRVEVQVVLLELLDAGCRPGPGRSPSAGRSCPRSRGPTAGGRTGRGRTRARPPRSSARPRKHRASRPRRSRGSGSTTVCSSESHLGRSLRDDVAAVEVLAAVAVAVDGEQHLRLDLREAVDDAARAEVGRAARPDGAERGACEERGQRSRGCSACRRRRGRPRRRRGARSPAAMRAVCVAQLAPGPLAAARAARRRGGCATRRPVAAAEDVLGVGEPAPREPLGARHLAVAQARARRCGRPARRRTPRRPTRTRRGRRPTSATAPRSPRPAPHGARPPSS